MGRAKWLGVLLCVVLLFSLGGTVASASGDNPGKGPPQISKIVLVHYAQGKGWGPGGNPNKGGGGEKEGGKLWYKYSGIHWPDSVVLSDDGVKYAVNLTGRGAGDAGEKASFMAGIAAAFQTWEDKPNSYMNFTDLGRTSASISSLNNQLDRLNVVGWANISDAYPGAIAVTIVWYYTLTGEIVEVDMALNSDPAFAWHQNDIGGADPDTAAWTEGNTPAYDVDVQNIVTHEAGHWLMLDDLYQKPANDQTMYGRSGEFDLQKRSLESGDEAGIQTIYPQ